MNPRRPVGIVAGSGIDLRGLLDEVTEERAFTEFSGMGPSQIAGHPGRFLFGARGETPLILQLGRPHFYEGHDYSAVTRPVEVMREFGADTLICTNAAGGLDDAMAPGDLMAADRIRLWPFRHWPNHPETLAPDFTVAGCERRGTYYWVHGPCYETRAEIRALQALEGDAVGMSTAAEVHRAQALGMRTAAVSCITNTCRRPQVLTHQHVLEMARATSSRLCAILRSALGREDIAAHAHPKNTRAEKC